MSPASTGLSAWEKTSILPAKYADRLTFTVSETAALLRLSKWATYEAVKRGELATITLGRRKMVPRRVVEDLLTNGNSEPAD
jgi:excisionase family DNA binding protein